MTTGDAEALAITVAQAAARLSVTRTRIYQLLESGDLEGPTYPGRAPNGAPRVRLDSLQGYEQRAQLGRSGPRAVARLGDDVRLEQAREQLREARSEQARLHAELERTKQERDRAQGIAARERAVAQRMKVTADLAREQARLDRRRAAEMRALVDGREADLVRLDAMGEELSEALTQYLGPDDATGI